MPVLYIVRHGHCDSNVPGMIQGQTDSPLTDLGIRQAGAIADRLSSESFAAIYSSDLSRTRNTAAPIAARHGLQVRHTPLLRECCLGAAQGLTESQFEEQYPAQCALWREDPIANRPPGAERFEEVIARCGRFISEISAAHPADEKLVVVGHIGSICGLVCATFDLPVRFYLEMHVSNASLSIIEIGKKPVLRMLNDSCHLTD